MILLALLACTAGHGDAPDWRSQVAAWRVGEPLPDFPLVDQDGRAYQLADLRGDHVLLGFFYTRCGVAEACPMTTERMKAAADAWKAADHGGRTLHLLSVTLDPADDPAALRAYADAHGVDTSMWTLATGSPDVLDAFASLYDVAAVPSAGGQLSHRVVVGMIEPGLVPGPEWDDEAFAPEDVVREAMR